MPPNLMGLVVAPVAVIVTVTVGVGFPALAVIAVKYFKFKERELTLDLERKQQARQQDLALEKRVQRLEEVLSSLDHDVRVRLQMEPAPPFPVLVEELQAPDAAPEASVAPIPTRVR